MTSDVERIKERLSIHDVISSYIKLEKAGNNFRARCPFHQEKTPSFFVSPVRNTYYCFGCGEKGDIFSFVQKYEGLDFTGALKLLAERAGVPLENRGADNRERYKRLYLLLEAATLFFERELATNRGPLDYLKSRGLTSATIKDFRLGYAPPAWRMTTEHLKGLGFTEEEIEQAGLGKRTDGSFYDRFRGRIMFPIMDATGRPVAFSGRIYDMPKNQDLAGGKYINSPETPLYVKSKILFGFDKAKEGIRRLNCAIVVEGQMDLIMCHQAGYRNTVAISGTALSSVQIEALKRLSNNLILALDADSAGLRASGKSAALALSLGMEVKVVSLSGGKDPADMILVSKDSWKQTVRSAKHVIDFLLDNLAARNLSEREFRRETGRTVLPFVALVTGAIDRAHFIAKIASVLRVPEHAVEEDVAKAPPLLKEEEAQTELLAEEVPPQTRKQTLLRAVFGILASRAGVSDFAAQDMPHIAELTQLLGEDEFKQYSSNDEYLNEVAFEAEKTYDAENLEEIFKGLYQSLRREILQELRVMKTLAIREKELAGLHEEAKKIQQEQKKIIEELLTLND